MVHYAALGLGMMGEAAVDTPGVMEVLMGMLSHADTESGMRSNNPGPDGCSGSKNPVGPQGANDLLRRHNP
jgi:hypothetical protein